MSQDLHCRRCNKLMATLRDAKVRTGLVVYCAHCNASIEMLLSAGRGHESSALEGLFQILGGGKRP